ncbi:MAG: hypothetical protein ACREYF_29445 [Gammaproteobacteria bacterium]
MRNDSISQERQLLARFGQQKHGLMHDVLASRVSVPVSETATA